MHKSKINFCLENKVALVTGAGHGIGAGCARQLSLAGAIVALNDHPDSKDIDTTAKVISRESGQRTTVIRADYFDESERINLLNNTLSAFDHIDILICNPYKSIQKPSINWSLVEFREIFEAVFISHFHMAQLVAREIKKADRKKGCIIFISSEFGTPEMNRSKSVGYDCGKAALLKLTRILALEWIEYGIRVNSIAPGATDTPGERNFAGEKKLQKDWRKLPSGKPCDLSHIGMEAVAIAANEMINGSERLINGGEHLV